MFQDLNSGFRKIIPFFIYLVTFHGYDLIFSELGHKSLGNARLIVVGIPEYFTYFIDQLRFCLFFFGWLFLDYISPISTKSSTRKIREKRVLEKRISCNSASQNSWQRWRWCTASPPHLLDLYVANNHPNTSYGLDISADLSSLVSTTAQFRQRSNSTSACKGENQ